MELLTLKKQIQNDYKIYQECKMMEYDFYVHDNYEKYILLGGKLKIEEIIK